MYYAVYQQGDEIVYVKNRPKCLPIHTSSNLMYIFSVKKSHNN
jgi:hypothetical protein